MSEPEAGYDWVDDESLDLASTLARLDQLEPATIERPELKPHLTVATPPASTGAVAAVWSERLFMGTSEASATIVS